MTQPQYPPNNIKALLVKKGWSANELARAIGTSGAHMSRLIHRKSPLSPKWLLKISGALKVSTNKITGIELRAKVKGEFDDTAFGLVIGWLQQAQKDYGIELSHEQLGRLTTFVYKEFVEQNLRTDAAREMAYTLIRSKRIWDGR